MSKVLTGGALIVAAAAAYTYGVPSENRNQASRNFSLVLGVMAEHGHVDAEQMPNGKLHIKLSEQAFLECEDGIPVAAAAPGNYDILADRSAPGLCARAAETLKTF